MLEGDIFWRRQDTLAAMHAFRRAIDLNLDYLDKHTDLFQGKKIRKVVEEAKSILEKGSRNPTEQIRLKSAKKEYYYMLSKLAGGCNG